MDKLGHLDRPTVKAIITLLFGQDIIAWDIWNLRPAGVPVSHSFELKDPEPIFHRPRRQPPKWNEVIRSNVESMLEGEIITPTSSL